MAGAIFIFIALYASLTVLVTGALLIVLGARWLQRDAVLRGKAAGVNLEARRGEPAIWLVAHLDSKSQPIPILVRAGAIIACIVVWVAMVTMAALKIEGTPWIAATVAAVLALGLTLQS